MESMISNSIEKLLSEAMAIEAQGAKESDNLGFMARALTMCTLPHSNPGDIAVWGRENGNFSLVIQPGVLLKGGRPVNVGIPYGVIPRLLMCWMATEAVKTKSRNLVLGDSLSDFMRELDLIPTGGRWGSITRLKEQMRRLFSCSIALHYEDRQRESGLNFRIAKGYNLWFHPQQPDQAGLWQSTITLSEEFFDEVTKYPVPIDLRAIKALRKSPLALDLYIWLTYRNSYLKKETVITWEQLQLQFGAEYHRVQDFKRKFNGALRKVQVVYPAAKLQSIAHGLKLSPSNTHVLK